VQSKKKNEKNYQKMKKAPGKLRDRKDLKKIDNKSLEKTIGKKF
jgi:hypothetical protein